ncbi:MAG: Na+/H+ antiporter NhaC family protein [Bacteroidales bacterium]|nr:Na+/H+ antiporter NhaC family protein [Bacteroidales bacterium]MCF8327231.1 Na+/H+ antiporter NhaC family protein [Bacteroidales bacterium]
MAKKISVLFFLLLLISAAYGNSKNVELNQDDVELDYFPVVVKTIPVDFTISIQDSLKRSNLEGSYVDVLVNGEKQELPVAKGQIKISKKIRDKTQLTIQIDNAEFREDINPIPLWMSILPPLLAIVMALLFKEVFTALFTGLLLGTSIIHFYQGGNILLSIGRGILSIVDTYIINALSDKGHLSIIVFSLLIGGMVNIITRNGGMRGVVNRLSVYASNARNGQLVTWFLGLLIFFDDYANTLVVGNTMRPVTDKLKISRQKLAYIVDSTAAPIASIAFITTWIGAELSYISNGIQTIGLEQTPYSVFFNSLAYSFYPIFALIFILFIVVKRRDYGPMLKAERKARHRQPSEADDERMGFSNKLNELRAMDGIKHKSFNAVIPVLVIIVGAFAGLIYTGIETTGWSEQMSFTKNISNVIGHADSYQALLWSSLAGILTAIVLTLIQKLMSLEDTVSSMINGFRTMLTAIVILVLAWSIAEVTQHMHTANFISQILLDMNMTPYWVPTLTFIMAALVAFSTGSSWGTMAILYPLILPASWLICQENGLDHQASLSIFYNVVSTVLAGSVLGDHCSPISDTTILSSLASSCNHIAHVRTQLPYALTVGVVAIVFGTLPAAYGISSLILFPVGIEVLFLVVHVFGRNVWKSPGS